MKLRILHDISVMEKVGDGFIVAYVFTIDDFWCVDERTGFCQGLCLGILCEEPNSVYCW